MDTFYSVTNQSNFTFDENDEGTDAFSSKMNRSRMLLSEFGNDSTNLSMGSSPSRFQSTLIKQPKSQQSLLRSKPLVQTTSSVSNEPSPSILFFTFF